MNPLQRIARMLFGLVLCVVCLPALADPPALVGRVAVIEGDVRLVPEEGAEPIASPYNFPLAPEARLYSGADGRTAVQVGNVSLWLAENGELGFTDVDEGILDLDLTAGVLVARVGAGLEDDEPVRIATLPAGVSLLGPGRYRVESDTVETRVTVSEGLARVEAGADVAYVSAGQTLVANTGGVLSHAASDPAAESDAFAHWVATHSLVATGETVRHVSPAMTGWQDLDRHGYWRETVEYGPLWSPTHVPYGWAPYRHGSWVWLSPWGWTWVDRAPWGFAPFHYGRWVEYRGRWCWSPGRRLHRPAFAPALVAFDWDDGRHGRPHHRHRPPHKWKPLAPHEAFEPDFDATPRFRERVNAPHLDRRHARRDDGPSEFAHRRRDEVRRQVAPDGEVPIGDARGARLVRDGDRIRDRDRVRERDRVRDRDRDAERDRRAWGGARPPGYAADPEAPAPRAAPGWRGVGPDRPAGVSPPDTRGVQPGGPQDFSQRRSDSGIVREPPRRGRDRPATDLRPGGRQFAEPSPERPAMRGIDRSARPDRGREVRGAPPAAFDGPRSSRGGQASESGIAERSRANRAAASQPRSSMERSNAFGGGAPESGFAGRR